MVVQNCTIHLLVIHHPLAARSEDTIVAPQDLCSAAARAFSSSLVDIAPARVLAPTDHDLVLLSGGRPLVLGRAAPPRGEEEVVPPAARVLVRRLDGVGRLCLGEVLRQMRDVLVRAVSELGRGRGKKKQKKTRVVGTER